MALRALPDESTFVELREELFAIAYRMLGSASEAEDVLQDAYLRWRRQTEATIQKPKAYLTTLVTRLCIDFLTSARRRREQYVGPWLPEPLVVDESDPLQGAEMADSLTLAFLVLLEELTPPERAAFLLREVFEYEYGEISEVLTRSEESCRQLVSRARAHVAGRRRRFDADRTHVRELTTRFIGACASGSVEDLMSLLAPDVVVWTDGGGKAKAAPRPVIGAHRASRFLVGISRDVSVDASVRQLSLNGQPGIVISRGTKVLEAVVLDVEGGKICGVRVVANPDKLGAVERAVATRGGAPGLQDFS